MANKSYREVFVANTGTLLANGATVETITDGQIGILDAKTYLSDTTPTYANQKAIKIVWGTTDADHLLTTSGVPNENIYTKLIKGKNIIGWKGIAADATGTKEVVHIGNIGSGTLTLTADKGEVKHIFVKLTGEPINKKFSPQGVIKKYSVVDGLVGESGAASALNLATDLAAAINADKDINSFVTAAVVNTSSTYYGVRITVDNVDRVVSDAAYQYFPRFEDNVIHVEVSEFDPNYNNEVEAAVTSWTVTKTTDYSSTVGSGYAVRKWEEEALSYHLRERSHDPVVREIEEYAFKTVPTTFYDEFILTFEFSYHVGGWSEKITEIHELHVFFATGTGDPFEAAINGYIADIGLPLDPVNLVP